MFARRLVLRCVLPAVGLLLIGLGWLGAQPPNFDKLSDEDRNAFAKRFEKEIWPLLLRSGENGCVGCHNKGKIVSSLKMSGRMDRDFRMLVRDGFFLKDDAGSLLARVLEKDAKRRMPPPTKGPRWTPTEVKILTDFVNDMDKKQKK